MENVPASLGIGFGLVTGLVVWLFYVAAGRSGRTLGVLGIWLGLQGALALSGFYTVVGGRPPRLLLLAGPPVVLLAALFATAGGRRYLDGLNLKMLTLLHVVRVPVELVLYGLFLHQAVPQLMTFEGRNWDVFSGLSAPLVYYLVFNRKIWSRRTLGLWNVLCLGLLLNVLVNGILSAPSILQQFAFTQPNRAILYFPFGWLPGCVVPIVLLSHLAALRQLWAKKPVLTAGPLTVAG